MPSNYQPPARCRRCGQTFPSGFAIGAGSRRVLMQHNTVSCPWCGSVADVADTLVDDAGQPWVRASWIASVREARLLPEDILLLRRLHREVRKGLRRAEEAHNVARASSERLRHFEEIERARGRDRPFARFESRAWAILGLLVALYTWMNPRAPAQRSEIPRPGIEIATPADQAAVRPRSVRGQPTIRQQRNDPCSCGSGKKYKRCCGATGRG